MFKVVISQLHFLKCVISTEMFNCKHATSSSGDAWLEQNPLDEDKTLYFHSDRLQVNTVFALFKKGGLEFCAQRRFHLTLSQDENIHF